MDVYLLRRAYGTVGYDQYASMVVVAGSPEEARALAAARTLRDDFPDWGDDVEDRSAALFADPAQATVELVRLDAARVVHTYYWHG